MIQNDLLVLHYSKFLFSYQDIINEIGKIIFLRTGVGDSFSFFMVNFFWIQLVVSKTKMMPALAAWI